jgi:hypothetical protein
MLRTHIAAAAIDTQSMVRGLYQEFMARKEILPAITSFAQPPVYIDDALGWTFAIPLEIVGSWTVGYSLILLP